MAAVINTNYLSLVAQNNLNKSQSSLGTAIERLSSGMRINSAKDDAAGMAIANRFTSNVRGLTQAARNANDGISIAQTTEGATAEITTHLQRIRELSVQAANGTYSSTDLASMQAEVQQRMDDIDRISQQTDFNGVKVLSNDTELQLQVGARDGETITLNLKKIDTESLGLNSGDALEIFNIGGPAFANATDAAADIAGTTTAGVVQDASQIFAEGATGTSSIITANGTTVDNLVRDERGNFYVGDTTTGYRAATVTLNADGQAVVNWNADATAMGLATKGSMSIVDNALNVVDTLRSDLGAVQNRLESTVANLNSIVNNLSASRSRIEDADYAVEVSNMTRAQILQQAGTSVLAQANQVPQTVLSLLG